MTNHYQMTNYRSIALAVLLVGAAALVAGVAAPPASGQESSAGGLAAATAEGLEPERVVIEVALRADGSAHWTVEHRVRLDDPADEQGFERSRQRVRDNRSAFREPFTRRVRAMATDAEDTTGRTMIVQNVSVAAYRTELTGGAYGVVEYSFRWHGFAATDDRLRAGDALTGFFLDSNTTLLVTWPGGATLAEVAPAPDTQREQTAVWEGPIEFTRNEPRVVVESSSLSFGPDPILPGRSNDLLVTLLVLGSLVGTAVVAVVGWRRSWFDRLSGDVAPRPREDSVEQEGESGVEDSGRVDAQSGDQETQTASGATDSADEPAPPSDLLSNEEQVLALLDERGGRMKQQEVVSELEWSETKTSEVVSDLRDAEEIEVYRLGRENVLALPGTGLGLDTGGEEE